MTNVVYLQATCKEPEPFDTIAWLRDELKKPHPPHRAEFIRERIQHLEAQRKEAGE